MATTMGTTADATAKDAPVIERVDVTADGDLILLVHGKLELRVHSLLLKMNSPVFRAMLGPNWLEGQTLSSISETTPGILALPDDDGDGMKYLCCILHHRNDELSASPAARTLLTIAKTADKYDCIMHTRMTFEAWFSRAGHLDYDHLATAYVLGDHVYFKKFSRETILHGSRRYFEYYLKATPENGNDEFGIIAAVKHRYDYLDKIIAGGVSHMVELMCEFLHEDRKHYVSNPPGVGPDDEDEFESGSGDPEFCQYHQNMVPVILTAMVSAEVWPLPDTLAGLFVALKKLKLPKFDDDLYDPCSQEWNNGNWYSEDYYTAFGKFGDLTMYAERANGALCLDCVKSPGGKNEGICAEHHPKATINLQHHSSGDAHLHYIQTSRALRISAGEISMY